MGERGTKNMSGVQILMENYMKVTDEMIQKVHNIIWKRGNSHDAVKEALEAVFGLIEKENADNDYWYKKYNEQFLEKDKLKEFIAINCFNWKPYKSGLNAEQEIYAPCQDAEDTVELGWSVWKLVDDMIINKKEAKEQPNNEGWIDYTDFWYREYFEKMYWQCPDGIRKELLEIKRKDGTTDTGYGEWIIWHEGIIAYRILPNQTQEKGKIPTLEMYFDDLGLPLNGIGKIISEYLEKHMQEKTA